MILQYNNIDQGTKTVESEFLIPRTGALEPGFGLVPCSTSQPYYQGLVCGNLAVVGQERFSAFSAA